MAPRTVAFRRRAAADRRRQRRTGAAQAHRRRAAAHRCVSLLYTYGRSTLLKNPRKKKEKKNRKKDLQAPEHTYAPTSPLGLTPSQSHTTFIPPKGGGAV